MKHEEINWKALLGTKEHKTRTVARMLDVSLECARYHLKKALKNSKVVKIKKDGKRDIFWKSA